MPKRPVYSIPDSISAIKDPELQRILVPLIQAWNVRNGQTGNGDEKFLTRRDLEDLIANDKRIQSGINGVANPPPKPGTPPGGVGDKIREISKAIFNDPLWLYLGQKITRIGEKIKGVEVRVVKEEEIRTSENTAIYNRIDKVVFGSTAIAWDDDGFPDFQGPTGAIQTSLQGLANEQASIATLTTAVEAALEGYLVYDSEGNPVEAAGTIEEKFEAKADTTAVESINGRLENTEGDVDQLDNSVRNISLQYSVKVDNQGYVAGFGIMSSPATIDDACNAGLGANEPTPSPICSRFYVRADVFAVGHPDPPPDPETGEPQETVAPVVPFIIRGGKVYIDQAMIRDATIDTAKINWLFANKIVGGLNRVTPIRMSPNWFAPKRDDTGLLNFSEYLVGTIYPEEIPSDIAASLPSGAHAYRPCATVSVEFTIKAGGTHEDTGYLKVKLKNKSTGGTTESGVLSCFTKEAGTVTVTHALNDRKTDPFEVYIMVGTHHKDGVITEVNGTLMALR